MTDKRLKQVALALLVVTLTFYGVDNIMKPSDEDFSWGILLMAGAVYLSTLLYKSFKNFE